jgi:predicted small secreted protein
MRKIVVALFGSLVVAASLAACNTVEGVGRDVSAVGRAATEPFRR